MKWKFWLQSRRVNLENENSTWLALTIRNDLLFLLFLQV